MLAKSCVSVPAKKVTIKPFKKVLDIKMENVLYHCPFFWSNVAGMYMRYLGKQ